MTSVQHDPLLGTELMHEHVSADISDLTTTLDPRYLKLDQTTPQTTVGTFTFPTIKLGGTLATGLVKHTTTTGVLSITPDNSTNWDTAYSWGNHASAGYLTSALASSTYAKIDQTTPNTLLGTWTLPIVHTPTINGGILANDNITIQGTTHATRTTSYVLLQPNGGNVGIGTTAPGSLFEMSSAVPRLKINGSTIGALRGIDFASQTTNFAAIEANAQTGELRIGSGPSAAWGGLLTFYQDQVEAMRIDTSGNVGIGTTSPGGRAHINGTVDDQQLIVEAHSTQTNNIVEIHDSSSNVLVSFNGVGGAVINEQGSATGDFRVESDTEENMIFLDANGSTDGELYLGGTTNGVKILKGGSLSFIGTAGITDATNINLGTTTGSKIGNSATAKLALYDATPIVRQNHIVDADGTLADATTKINAILVALENLGVVKTA